MFVSPYQELEKLRLVLTAGGVSHIVCHVLYIVNAIVLRIFIKHKGSAGHPVGHYGGLPLSPWTLDLNIIGLNSMCDTLLRMFFSPFGI